MNPQDPTTSAPPAPNERRATVRIDGASSGGKKFQGVWLEFADDKRWVIDYRPRELWKPFEDREVIVAGACYQPFGQAISATHFRVDHMRFVKPERGRGPILEIGAEQWIRGAFALHEFPAGSKLADSPMRVFRADDGTEFFLAGASEELPAAGKAARVKAREVTPDMTYMAQVGGRNIWILEVRDPDSVEDAAYAPKPIDCP